MCINDLVALFAPSIVNKVACNKIKEKINGGDGVNPPIDYGGIEAWTVEGLKEIYESELTVKSKFEDKAKTNVIGITISVTLIMGGSTLLQNVANKYSEGGSYWFAFIMYIGAVIYMLAAGLHAIHVITSENVVHRPDPKTSENELKREYNTAIALNRARDLIRNNYVFTSYECIRNSLFCLFVVMVISVVPINSTKTNNTGAVNNNFYYSSQAMLSIKDCVDQNALERFIIEQIANGRGGEESVINDTEHLFIKYSLEGNKINVYLVEPYEP